MLALDPWRIEEACRRSWPAAEEALLHGWLARASGGPFRRINSATPGPEAAPLLEALPDLRAYFAARALPLMLRLPDMAQIGESDVTGAGFGPPEALTNILHAPIAPIGNSPGRPEHKVMISALRPGPNWLAARADLAGEAPMVAAATGRLIESIKAPIAFASIERDGRIVSLALVTVTAGLAVFEAVRTDPAWHGQGLARSSVLALLEWAEGQGAKTAIMPVMADNASAQHLYAGLGFTQCAYRYHYRRHYRQLGTEQG